MTDDAMIRLDRVSKTYADGTAAVSELSLDVGRGEICVLVGPSGCGKTTTMKMVNRLIDPTSGTVYVDGQDISRTNPTELRRRIGYVIQNVGLFPHQRVRDNVMTVPRLLGWDRGRARQRAGELLELVGLDPAVYGGRYPAQLSGGQRQRVGVARALAADPLVLLMDEPFSAVDPVARERLQTEFLRVQAEVGTTVVLVTHDIDEAVRLGTRVAILREGGHLEQYAPPADLLTAPATEFVAGFVGSDRMVKALSVMPLATDGLEPGTAQTAVSADVDLGRALVALLAGGGRVEVRDGDRSLGVLTAEGLVRQAAARPAG
ncbi:MAG: glycine betaine/L-proline transporter, ATPase subunit [Frankiales bacterium]|nr:glycine betaine/L-proline transporter, ATPase subunit [Frankiales bacterium]